MKCCDLYPGILREPVEFQRKTTTVKQTGGQSETWAAITGAPTRARVDPISGSEVYRAQRIDASIRYKMFTRYFPDLREGDIVIIRERRHNIRFIRNIEMRDRWLEIMLEGGVAI